MGRARTEALGRHSKRVGEVFSEGNYPDGWLLGVFFFPSQVSGVPTNKLGFSDAGMQQTAKGTEAEVVNLLSRSWVLGGHNTLFGPSAGCSSGFLCFNFALSVLIFLVACQNNAFSYGAVKILVSWRTQ